MNIAQIAGRLRGKMVQFSGKLSLGLPKVMRRFVAVKGDVGSKTT